MAPIAAARERADPALPRVLYVGFSDLRGGAAIASSRLIQKLVSNGQVAALELVNLQLGNAPWTLSLNGAFRSQIWHQSRKVFAARNVAMSDPYGWLPMEAAYFQRVLDVWQPDVIHLHNLHGGRGIIPLAILPHAAKTAPIVWTLHDMWLTTGHCAYSLGCERWRVGCGDCPDLSLYPHLLRDKTRAIVAEKAPLLAEANPILVTPSQWLANVAALSPATKQLRSRVIANGVDLSLFAPDHRDQKRAEMNIGPDDVTIMFAAETLSGDPRKGAIELRQAVSILSNQKRDAPIHVILMGNAGDEVLAGLPNLKPHNIGYVSDPLTAAQLYAAADLFVCPSLQDNLPNTLLEASACGTASLVFDGSGSGETIEDGVTGAIVELGDTATLAQQISKLISNPDRLREMGQAARARAENLYSDERMAVDYLNLYQNLIEQRSEAI